MHSFPSVVLMAATLALAAGCSGGGVRYGAQRTAADIELEARFHAADTDKDELLSLEEARAGMPELVDLFATIDTDGSGKLTLAEIRSYAEWRRISTMPERRRF